MRSQLPQACLFCFHCTNHSDEPYLELAVPRCKNSCKIASQWNFCTPESCSYGLSSKCFDLIQKRLPRVTSLLSIVQRQQNQTRLCSRCYFRIRVDSACMLNSFTKMFRKQYITPGHGWGRSGFCQLRLLSGEVRAN